MFHCPYLAALLNKTRFCKKNYYCVAENKFLTNAQANYLCQIKHSDFRFALFTVRGAAQSAQNPLPTLLKFNF